MDQELCDDEKIEDLWLDIRRRMRKAKLTKLQRRYLELHFLGQTPTQMARRVNRDSSTVRRHITTGLIKMQGVPGREELSILIKALGWKQLREMLIGHILGSRFQKGPRPRAW